MGNALYLLNRYEEAMEQYKLLFNIIHPVQMDIIIMDSCYL